MPIFWLLSSVLRIVVNACDLRRKECARDGGAVVLAAATSFLFLGSLQPLHLARAPATPCLADFAHQDVPVIKRTLLDDAGQLGRNVNFTLAPTIAALWGDRIRSVALESRFDIGNVPSPEPAAWAVGVSTLSLGFGPCRNFGHVLGICHSIG
jgi:hypothetical protein